ncbi:MAG TPA: penicillin acylase family protein [Steroidobacteraceae bacterium]|jgi:penicillin amidase|nr:penicillin acylase family protein [Steroidobacteraceae bacterium]
MREKNLLLLPIAALWLAFAYPLPAHAQSSLADAARKALAVQTGRLHVPGLEHPVHVLRDRWGVAHIRAETQHDLFYAQGFIAAQDRLFQMEVWKRAGQGRLAEILGPSAFARDVSARELAYRGDMNAEYRSYAPDTQEILEAFTQGINAYIRGLTASGGPGLPVEFKLAGFAPEPWSPRDCLNRMAAFSMTGNAANELHYAQALAELGSSKAAKILDFDPAVALDPDPRLILAGLTPDLMKDFIGSDQRIAFPARPIEGSNNWTISGSRTATGKPLLANDPHRVLALPSLRYMVHLMAPGWNVIGAGEPGLPGVALGHNERIAWGFTIFGLDQQDLYVEELNTANPRQYKSRNGWKDMTVERETIRIAGAPDRAVDFKFTEHGPVVWEDRARALTLRWVGSEPGTAGYLASLSVDRAQNWDQFEQAVARWKVPSENIVYADRAGNIGEHSAGLAPVRHWTGLLPVPGGGAYEWAGFIASAELPHSFNPAAGYVASANHKMIPDGYRYRVGYEWDPGYRFARIKAVIEKAGADNHKLSMADMQALQGDVTSLPAIEFQKLVRSTSLGGDASLRALLSWDGRLTRDSGEAALYEVWLREITQALGSQISPQFAEHYQDLPLNTVLRMMRHPDPELFGPNPGMRRDQLLRETLQSARRALEKELGPDSSRWRWGALHQIRFRHALDERSPDAKGVLDIAPLPRPGDGFTVDATGVPAGSWDQVSGASYREIIDLGDWDRSVAVNAPGQSGQPGSAHYRDLVPLWDAGDYFPLLYSAESVAKAKAGELILEPGS